MNTVLTRSAICALGLSLFGCSTDSEPTEVNSGLNPETETPAPEAEMPAPEAETPAPEAETPAPEAEAPVDGLTVAAGAMDTQIIAAAAGQQIAEDWGTLVLHSNETNTYGLEKLVTGIATIKPGEEIHAPHVHEEEEFLFVAEGSGTWTVEGETFAAQPGDLLYSEPWKLHGVTNTGDEPLVFYFFKWNNRGVAAPAEATGALGSLLTKVITQASTELITDDWGTLNLYTNEESTFGMEKMVTGIADIAPGKEIHPPHAHEEEEFLYVVSGSGTWTVNDETMPATAGDLLYAKPQDLHGILNTGDTTLRFYFVKWNNKGVVVTQ